MINYMERPAPSRITPWPGNIEPVVIDFSITDYFSKSGITMDYKGEVTEYKSAAEAARVLGIEASKLHGMIRRGVMPDIEGLECIYNDDSMINHAAGRKSKKVFCVMESGDELDFISLSEAAKYFDVSVTTVAKWGKMGRSAVRGIESISTYWEE